MRHHGMRLIGPNCIGVVNTNPSIRMNATFAPTRPLPGRVGFASQSGGLGIALLARLEQIGLGLSTFVSTGNKADVSSNDLLQYWDEDPDTDVILLYLESFGNPSKFARLARRISAHKPVVALKSGRSPAGARGAQSHTAALAQPDVVVDELFRQAGVVRVDTLEALFETAVLFAHQPLPAGRRVAIVSNGGGPGILAADACMGAGLDVPELSTSMQSTLRTFTPPDAGLRNPVDLIASASAETYAKALKALLESDEIDAVLVLYVSPLVSRTEDIERAVLDAVRLTTKPLIACFSERRDPLGVLRGESNAAPVVPTFAFPEGAAGALGRAARLAEWRRHDPGTIPELENIDLNTARRLVEGAREFCPVGGGWLDGQAAFELMDCIGVPTAATALARDVEEAISAAEAFGYPVCLKAGSPELVHKVDAGGVRLDLDSKRAVRDAFDGMHALLGEAMGGALVQPMAPRGVEVIVGMTRDPLFGPLVLFGMGGSTAELLRDTALRIVPLTDVDVHDLVRSVRGSPLLFGYRGAAAIDVEALEQTILRIGRLAESIPEIAELDCNPVIASVQGCLAVDVKVRLAPLV